MGECCTTRRTILASGGWRANARFVPFGVGDYKLYLKVLEELARAS